MKKIAYNAPEMEVLNLKIASALLEASFSVDEPVVNPTEPENPGGMIIDD